MSDSPHPLDGIRVVDFGHVWAGPYCAATLADLGAEVIKVESERRIDVHRRQGPYAERKPGINRSGVWNAQNRNKKSVAIDLSTEAGRETALRLVAGADVVVENFSPGVMAKLGLDYDALVAVNPALVMASLSAFGQAGPQHHFVGYGPSLDAAAGLCSLNAYADGKPEAVGGMFPDTASALYAVFEILSALRRREETGKGCYIDLAELEVTALLIADMFVRFPGQEIPPEWAGNRDPYNVPQGAYPCRGVDRWIMISVDTEDSWKALCGILRRSEWVADPAYSNPHLRSQRYPEIEEAIRNWTSARTEAEAFRILQAAGVAAGIAYDVPSLLEDEQLKARHFFRSIDHPEVGSHVVYAPIWRFDGEDGEVRPAPMLGHDTDRIVAALPSIRW